MKKRREGCDLVVIDYLHILDGHGQRGETPEQIIGRQVKAIKKLALEAQCSILLVSQMNRQSENRAEKQYQPILSDLRDSGVIEQEADCVFFVHCPERHGILQDKNGKSMVGITQLIIRKSRHSGIGTIDLNHNESRTHYRNGK